MGATASSYLDETELEIEQLLDAAVDELPRPVGGEIGTVSDQPDAKHAYLAFLKETVTASFTGVKVVLDCANGSAYELAPTIFRELGAEVITIGAEPNGRNINDDCGSTHPEMLRDEVVKHGAAIGLAFDGDADRLIAIDEKGDEVDGDFILSILWRCAESQREAEPRHHRDDGDGEYRLFQRHRKSGLESTANSCRRPLRDGRDA